jgi:hypothetical protein
MQRQNLPEQWKQLKKSIDENIKRSDAVIEDASTNECPSEDEISKSLKAILTFLGHMDKLAELSTSLRQAKLQPKKKNQIQKEISTTTLVVGSKHIQLCTSYIEKLICKIDTLSHPDNYHERRKYINFAFEGINCLENSCDNKEKINLFMDALMARYHLYFDINPEDPALPLLKQAVQSSDALEMYNIYLQALDIAARNNNPLLLYRIAYEQSGNAAKIFNEQDPAHIQQLDIALRIKYSKMTYDPLVFAAQLIANKKIKAPSPSESIGICQVLYKAVEFFLNATSQKTYQQDFDKREALLKDARDYFTHGRELARFISVTMTDTNQLYVFLTRKMRELAQERECSKAKKQEEEEKKEALQIYHQNYSELLKECNDDANKKLMHKIKRQPKKSEEPAELRKTASSSSEEENENHIITEEPIKTFDLDQQLQLLHEAECINDVMQQVGLNVDISDYYRLIAIKHINKKEVESSIIYLERTLDYLTSAANLIQAIKIKNNIADPDDFKIKDEWTQHLAKETRKLLDTMLERQTRMRMELEKSRERVKNDIINKNGRQAWFKNNKSTLSPHALKLQDVRESVESLNAMCKKLDDVYACLEISAKETMTVPAKETVNPPQITLFRRRSFHEMPRETGEVKVRRMSV